MDLTRPGHVFGLDGSLQPTLQDMNKRLDDPSIQGGVCDPGDRVTLVIFNCANR